MLNILSYIIVALTLVVGVSVLTSNRGTKGRFSALSLALAYFGAGFWSLFVMLFRNSTDVSMATMFHQAFAVIALLIPFGCIMFAMSITGKKALTIIVAILSLVIISIVGYNILVNSSLFFNEIIMSPGNNHAALTDSWLSSAYSGIFGIFLVVSVIIIYIKAIKSKKSNKEYSKGLLWLGFGLTVSVVLSLVFNLALPMLGNHELFWVGPLSISIAMLFTYFSTMRFRLFTNNSRILQYSSYLVVVAMAAMAYTCLFYIVFMLVFRGATPSDEMMIFQFIMVVIIILFLPTINHFIEYMKRIIAENCEASEGCEIKKKEEDAKK